MQNEKRSSRKVVRAKAGAKVDVSARAKTAGYRSVPYIWFQRPNDLPPFTFATIRGMLLDPGIRLNFAMRAAPIHGAEFGFKNGDKWQEGMKCDSPEIGQFIYRQLMHIWKNFLPSILRSQVWGWSAGEVTLRIDQSGLVVINELEPRHAADCRLLKLNHERWGVAINRVEDSGKVHLPFPYAWFHAYNAEDGDNYGVSAALGGYSPWADKWFNGGAIDVRRLFMHKDAYGGMDLGYPDGTTSIPGHAEPVPNVDIAQQIADKMKSGGVIVRPSERDDNGNEMWPLTRAQVPNNPQHILQFPKDLDDEIRRGMEIPDDVISADGSGAWAGKRVTLASFYASLDHWVVQIIRDLKSQIFDHLCLLNWGYVPEYEIAHKPLAEQAMEQQANAGPGAGGSPYPTRDGDGDGMIGEGYYRSPQGPARMSLDPVDAVGQGVLSAGQLVEAAQRVMRMGWSPYKGDRGGQGWINSETGEVRYQTGKPLESEPTDTTIEDDQQFLREMRGLRKVTGSDQAKQAAIAFINRPLENLDTGVLTIVSGNKLGKLLSRSSVENSISSQAHMMAVGNLDLLFQHAIDAGSRPPKEGNIKGLRAIRYFEIPLMFEGKPLRVRMLVKDYLAKDVGTRMYDLAALEINEAHVNRVEPSPKESVPIPPVGFNRKFSRLLELVKQNPKRQEE